MNYKELLKDPRWQKKRLEIMDRDSFICQVCSDKTKTLNVHHLRYAESGNPWDVSNEFLITLCEDCHSEEESCKRLLGEFLTEHFTERALLIQDAVKLIIAFDYYLERTICGSPREKVHDLLNIIDSAWDGGTVAKEVVKKECLK